MIYPDVSTESWVLKYNLRILDYTCPKCGVTFQTTVPIVTKDSAGLESPTHECGVNYKRVILTPRSDEAKREWQEIIDKLR